MANPTLAVLLRNGSHADATMRFALKCNDIAISYARTPIQIPIAQQSPELIDLGFIRPSLTCTGIVDTIGGDTNNTTAGVAGMESFLFTRTTVSATSGNAKWSDGGGVATPSDTRTQRYYVPYKNVLEEAVGTWLYLGVDSSLQIEIGDSQYPIDNFGGYVTGGETANRYLSTGTIQSTGGAIYLVAIQQGRFALNAAREDRYDFTLQFVITRRIDIP